MNNKLPVTKKNKWRRMILGYQCDHANGYQIINFYDFNDDPYTVHRYYNNTNNANRQLEGIVIYWGYNPFNIKPIKIK